MNVRDVAHLARIELSDEEAEVYQGQMDQILKYVEQLNSIDVEGIEPTAHAAPVAHDQIKMPKVVE